MASDVRRFSVGSRSDVGGAASRASLANARDGFATHHRSGAPRLGTCGGGSSPRVYDCHISERLPDPASVGLRHLLAPTAQGNDEALDLLTGILSYAVGDAASIMARDLLAETATFPRALVAAHHQVSAITGDDRVANLLALLARGYDHMLKVGMRAPDARPTADQVKLFLLSRLNHERVEVLYGLFFCPSGSLLHERELARGNASVCVPSAKEIARTALAVGAAAVVLGHNHPSGSAQPSRQDVRFSAEVAASLWLADAVLIDHLVIANGIAASMRHLGLLPEQADLQGDDR